MNFIDEIRKLIPMKVKRLFNRKYETNCVYSSKYLLNYNKTIILRL